MEQDLQAKLAAAEARIQELEHRLSQQTEQLRSFVQHAPVAMAMFDRDLNYLEVSEKYVWDWIGKREYRGKSHFELFPDMPDKWKETYRRCLKGVTESCREDPFKHPDGSIDYIDWVSAPWYNAQNEVRGIILYAERVNERVEDRQKLLMLNRQTRQSKEKLESLVYAISHNLQQPLMACLSVLELARENHRLDQFQDVQKHYNYLESTQRRMLASLRDFLAHTQLGQVSGLHWVNLNDLIDEICANLQTQIEQKQISISVPKLPRIQANEFEMMALFQNIIANAIRNNQHTAPLVEIDFKEMGDLWQFSIRDNGPGIPFDKQAGIFEHFRPVKSDKTEQEMGIGLAFCRRIVKSLNGKIWLDSKEGEGSVIYFSLPRLETPS